MKTEHGMDIEAPTTERVGNKLSHSLATAPHLYSEKSQNLETSKSQNTDPGVPGRNTTSAGNGAAGVPPGF